MADGKRSQSVISDDLDLSDVDLPPGSKRSKESNRDSDQRKIQNRIAQREFRQRKQQYIKDLEARLELHESAPNEQLDQLRVGIRALMDENQQLRTLLASLAGFVGEGLGSVVPKLQVDLPEFKALLSRGRTELVHQALDALHKANNQDPSTNQQRPDLNLSFATDSPSASRLSPAQYSPLGSSFRPATATATSTRPGPSSYAFQTPALGGNRTASTSSAMPQPITPSIPRGNQTGGSPCQPGQSPAGAPYGHSPAGSTGPGQAGTGIQQRSPNAQDKAAIARSEDWLKQGAIGGQQADVDEISENVQQMFSMPTDNPKLQAIQLISYHMRNKRDNPNYKLPPSLRATITQSSVPHSPFFDGIIFSSLRDRLILLKDQYDLATLLGDLIEAFSIHGQDCLVPQNWELSEAFLRKYWYVIDPEVLDIANRWRRERGDPELAMRDIVP